MRNQQRVVVWIISIFLLAFVAGCRKKVPVSAVAPPSPPPLKTEVASSAAVSVTDPPPPPSVTSVPAAPAKALSERMANARHDAYWFLGFLFHYFRSP